MVTVLASSGRTLGNPPPRRKVRAGFAPRNIARKIPSMPNDQLNTAELARLREMIDRAEIDEVHSLIRRDLTARFGAAGDATRILYGGSTNEKNIGEIMQQSDIDGALIGGAALKVESYAAMVRVTSELYR